MNLNDINLPSTCKVKYTKKMYYQKYMYKLIFEIDKSKLVKTLDNTVFSYRYTNYRNRLNLLSSLANGISNTVKNKEYRLRSEGIRVAVYINDTADIDELIKVLAHRLIEIEGPLNEKHADLIDNHRKVVVRSTLFQDRYRFKIYLKADWKHRESRYADVKEYLETQDKSSWAINHILDKFFNTNTSSRHCGYTAAVFMNSTDDLMMFQLRFNNDIEKIEEAVLLSEL